MEEQETKYNLSAVLIGHESDVKCVSVFLNGTIVTASRDFTVKLWRKTDKNYECYKTLTAHEDYVQGLKTVEKGIIPNFPREVIISGSKDKMIYVWDVDVIDSTNNDQEIRPTLTLIGHEGAVVCFDVLSNGDIVSGSWDKTGRLWRNGEQKFTLTGHTAAVWDIKVLSDGFTIATASADKTIRLWRGATCTHTIQAHEDCVRGLTPLSGRRFASCANDNMCKIWSENGEKVIGKLFGHENYVYSIAGNKDSKEEQDENNSNIPIQKSSNFLGVNFVTSSEDKTVKVWRDTECIDTLLHPKTVWSATWIPVYNPENESYEEDIVTACADYIVRIFSRSRNRIIDAKILDEYEKILAARNPNSTSIGGMDKSKMYSMESLNLPGKTNDEIRVCLNGNHAEAYQWKSTQGEWIKIGDLVDPPPNSQTQISGTPKEKIGDKEYDQVFDIIIDDMGQQYQLGYNNGDNPYILAKDLVMRNNLPYDFIENIANKIIQNITPTTISDSFTLDPLTDDGAYRPPTHRQQQFVNDFGGDPFTSDGAYHPTTYSQPKQFVDDFGGDPITGDGAYRPFQQNNYQPEIFQTMPTNTGNDMTDPFTSDGAYVPSILQKDTHNENQQEYTQEHSLKEKQIPDFYIDKFVSITGANTKRLIEIIVSTNSDLVSNEEYKISSLQISAIKELLEDSSSNSLKQFSHYQPIFDFIFNIAFPHWPSEHLYPFIDIIRFVMLDSSFAKSFISFIKKSNIDLISQILNIGGQLSTTAPIKNTKMILRFISNLFLIPETLELLQPHKLNILNSTSSFINIDPFIQIEFSTLYLNFAIEIIRSQKESKYLSKEEISLVTSITKFSQMDLPENVLHRFLSAGAILCVKNNNLVELFNQLDFGKALEKASKSSNQQISYIGNYLLSNFFF
ncbi:phospholipase a2-activating protein [Anaeramoeba ignava]|uniref:Phospholipase a2-activating protein n=1 Tax=Anaeramoeba ignava TaxID=1746090 RepID=A0A9Q0LZL5_ANAIG|nr:phospholipase a2-activating protein [Anaeramoeba ignava]